MLDKFKKVPIKELFCYKNSLLFETFMIKCIQMVIIMNFEFGEKVKQLRKRRDLKQDDLAKALNLSRGQIANLENGRRNLSLRQIEKLCKFFNVDMTYFIMAETTDSCLDLIDKAKVLFESKELTNEQKEDLFVSIMKIYLDSKDK